MMNCVLFKSKQFKENIFDNSLRFLIEHLVRVTNLQKQNKMTPENVATVFGPTLIHGGR